MNNEPGHGSESSTDNVDVTKKPLEIRESVLDTIDEETASDESEQTVTDTASQDKAAAVEAEDVTLEMETADDSATIPDVENATPSMSTEKTRRKERKKEAKIKKVAKVSATETDSPAAKARKTKLEKFKNADLINGKSKSKPKDDTPPYIESKYHKNIRYSIY